MLLTNLLRLPSNNVTVTPVRGERGWRKPKRMADNQSGKLQRVSLPYLLLERDPRALMAQKGVDPGAGTRSGVPFLCLQPRGGGGLGPDGPARDWLE